MWWEYQSRGMLFEYRLLSQLLVLRIPCREQDVLLARNQHLLSPLVRDPSRAAADGIRTRHHGLDASDRLLFRVCL